MKAADKGHAPVVAHLIKCGADVAHKDNVRRLASRLSPLLYFNCYFPRLSISLDSRRCI